MTGTCEIPGCGRERERRAWCGMHYQRWKKYGDPEVMTPRMKSAIAIPAFWAEVLASGGAEDRAQCLEWPGARYPKGYGHINAEIHGEHVVTRAVWVRLYGPIPDGMLVCHRCDNPPCAWPTHLFLGTPEDNSADMVAKGRSVGLTGNENPRTKIPAERIPEIRARRRGGEPLSWIASDFGVHPAHISRICNRKRREAA